MKSVIVLKCPRCGADLSADEDRDLLFCQYCGAKIMLTDENTFTINKNINKTIHTIDDASIARAETERIVKMHQIELEKEKANNNAKTAKIKRICSVFLGLCALVMLTENFLISLACVGGIILLWRLDDILPK